MPGLVLTITVAVAYDIAAVLRGWETITSAVKRIRRNPFGERAYAALDDHFKVDR